MRRGRAARSRPRPLGVLLAAAAAAATLLVWSQHVAVEMIMRPAAAAAAAPPPPREPALRAPELAPREAGFGPAPSAVGEEPSLRPDLVARAVERLARVRNGTVETHSDLENPAAVEAAIQRVIEVVARDVIVDVAKPDVPRGEPPPSYARLARKRREENLARGVQLPVALQAEVEACPHVQRERKDRGSAGGAGEDDRAKMRDASRMFRARMTSWSRSAAVRPERMRVEDFLCAAQCAAREPELEHSFEIFSITKYNLEGLLRLCEAGVFPFLVWIREGRVLRRACQARPTGTHAFESAITALVRVARGVDLPDVIFGFDGNDYAVPQTATPLKYSSAGWIHPLAQVVRFVGTDASPCPLFPTPPFLRSVGLIDERDDHEHRKKMPPWSSRSPTIFWRGGSTGMPFDPDFVYMMPRPQLVRKFRATEGFDVALTTTDGVSSAMRAAGFMETSRTAPLASRATFAAHRFLLHVDGNTASWGLAAKLEMGAVVLWQRSPVTYREHFYALLEPWTHYLPVAPNLADLAVLRDWLASPQGAEEVKAVRDRAAALRATRMRAEDAACYIVRLLWSMAALQDFDAGARELDAAGAARGIRAADFIEVAADGGY